MSKVKSKTGPAGSAGDGQGMSAEFAKQMQEAQEAATAERARYEAMQERSLRAQERLAEGVHALAAAVAGLGPRPSAPAVAAARPAQTRSKVEQAKPEAATEVEQAKPEAATEVPFAAVRKAIVALAEARGSDAAFAVLKKFGVEAISDLKPEQYAAVVTAAVESRTT